MEGSPVDAEPVTADWYPSEHGMLRYWDGSAWTSHYAPTPSRPDPSSAKVKRRAQVLGTIGVALIVCFVLVGLVWACRVTSSLATANPS
jgi:hypothetical protein